MRCRSRSPGSRRAGLARSAGANLTDASLAFADMPGANLGGANLNRDRARTAANGGHPRDGLGRLGTSPCSARVFRGFRQALHLECLGYQTSILVPPAPLRPRGTDLLLDLPTVGEPVLRIPDRTPGSTRQPGLSEWAVEGSNLRPWD
jgi:hypothetical protein